MSKCKKCLSDKEIIDTLERMAAEDEENFSYDVLNLIKRLKRESNSYRNKAKAQKGELARLNKQVADLTEKLEASGDPLQDAQYKIAEQQAEIERLTKIVEEQHEGSLIAMEVYKNEEIKELAVRLTDTIVDKSDRSLDNPNGNDYFISDVIEDIDNLVKEMVGENDG